MRRTLRKLLKFLHRPCDASSNLSCSPRKLAALGWLAIGVGLLLGVEEALTLRAELGGVSLLLGEGDALLELVGAVLYGGDGHDGGGVCSCGEWMG